MKKIILFLNILMSMLITSCSNDDITIPTPPNGAEGKSCEVSFWASIPEISNASRGTLGEATASSVETLSLLVFDAESGLYLYKSDATLDDQVIENGIHKGKYTAQLQLSDEPRIIHFVANVDDVAFQANELAVLSQLTKGENQDAYWQRAVAEKITATLEDGKYTNGQAQGITGTGTIIKLVRNFARITLSAAQNSGFSLAGFVLVNTATKGTVAPYMRQASDGNYFPNYDTDNDENGSAMTKYEALFTRGYKGVQPADATIDGTVPTASNLYTIDAKYLYERTQEETPVFIIAKRDMGNNNYRYYRIDIMRAGGTGEKDDYYKILRNFSYDITINSVEGEGYEDPATAAENVAANNLTASLELKDLTNIAYGNERLFVNKTEIVWTSEEPITFKYKYEKNGTGSNALLESLILGEAQNSSGAVCDFYEIYSSDTDADGYSTISISHTGLPASGFKEQEVTIKVGTLMRSINLILINPYQSTVGCDDESGLTAVPEEIPEIAKTVGSDVYVYFSMPRNLPESIFPLTFILAPEAHSITPNGANLPVVSLLNHANSTMQGLKYGFEKVVTWDDYKDSEETGMIVECPFKTSLAESATNIYVYNEYFNFPLSTNFTNPEGSSGGGSGSNTPTYTNVTIPANNLRATENISSWNLNNKTFTIYTDANYTNDIGTCTFTQSNGYYRLSSNLTLNIPNGVDTLYFVYREYNYTYYGSMSVSNIIDAENAQKTLNIQRKWN